MLNAQNFHYTLNKHNQKMSLNDPFTFVNISCSLHIVGILGLCGYCLVPGSGQVISHRYWAVAVKDFHIWRLSTGSSKTQKIHLAKRKWPKV